MPAILVNGNPHLWEKGLVPFALRTGAHQKTNKAAAKAANGRRKNEGNEKNQGRNR